MKRKGIHMRQISSSKRYVLQILVLAAGLLGAGCVPASADWTDSLGESSGVGHMISEFAPASSSSSTVVSAADFTAMRNAVAESVSEKMNSSVDFSRDLSQTFNPPAAIVVSTVAAGDGDGEGAEL